MAKKFQIDLQLDTRQADAAADKAAKAQQKIADAAIKAAAVAERAAEKAAAAALKAAEREAAQKQKIADRFLAAENARQIAAERATERAATAAIKAAERATSSITKATEREAAQKQKIADRFIAAENARGVAAERAKAAQAAAAVRTAEQEAAQKLRITDRFVTAEHRRMVEAERKKIALAEETARKAEEATARAQDRYTQVATGAALAIAAVIGQAFGGAVDAATDKAEGVSEKFKGTRGSLRELAQLEGKPLDAAFVTQFGEQSKRRGMTPAENIAFSTQVRNSAAQYIDTPDDQNRNMTPEMAESFMDEAAVLAKSRGLDPGVAADMAGVIMGDKKYKDMGAEEGVTDAFGKFSRVLAILDAGRGQAKQLGEQYVKLSAAALTPEGIGSFKSQEDVATAISLASQADPGRAFTGVMASLRGLRDFGNPLVKEAGVKPTDEYFDVITKMAPVLKGRADKGKMSIFDIANKTELNPAGFGDDVTARVIDVMVGEGVDPTLGGKGLIAQRRGVAALAGPERARAKIAAFRASDEGQQGVVDADAEAVDIKKGIASSKFDILRTQARSNLRETGDLDSTASEFGKEIQKWASRITGGIIPADRDRMKTDIEVLRGLKAAGADIPMEPLTGNLMFPGTAGYTNEGKQGFINEQIAGLESRGVSLADIVRALDNNAAKTDENTRAMRGDFGGSPGAGSWALPSSAAPRAGAIRP